MLFSRSELFDGDLWLNRIIGARKAFFIRTTCFFAWVICLVLSLTGLAIDSVYFEEYVVTQFVFFMGLNTLGLILVFHLSNQNLYWFYLIHTCAVLIQFNVASALSVAYGEYFLPMCALVLLFGAALMPSAPKPIFIISVIYWAGISSSYYFNLPKTDDMNRAWITANILALIAIGFAAIFYGLFTKLSNAVLWQKQKIRELNETTTLLNITLNENSFGLIGYDQDGWRRFERGAPVSRLSPEPQDSKSLVKIDQLQSMLDKHLTVPFSSLSDQLHEIVIGNKHYLLHIYQTRELTILSHMDVTDMREVEEKLRNNQKLSLIGEITSGVAHNYNNALTIALSNLEAIPVEKNRELWSGYIRPSVAAIEQSMEVSRKLLAMAGRQKLSIEVFDVARTIRSMRALILSALGSEIELKIITQGRYYIRTDKNEFESAILNLVINSRNAVDPKTGKITIKTTKNDGFVAVSVIDNGHGVDSEIQDKIFDPFFSTKSTQTSSGLGLSIVKGFVEQSDGHVLLKSSPKGTEISLCFPICPAQIVTDLPIDTPPVTRIPKSVSEKRILVVDDNVQVAKSLTRLINSLGYSASYQTSPEQAVETVAQDENIYLVFIDLSMPEMNGVEAARKMLASRSDLRLYMITGDVHSADMHGDDFSEFVEVLIKPVKAFKLREIIQSENHQVLQTAQNG